MKKPNQKKNEIVEQLPSITFGSKIPILFQDVFWEINETQLSNVLVVREETQLSNLSGFSSDPVSVHLWGFDGAAWANWKTAGFFLISYTGLVGVFRSQ